MLLSNEADVVLSVCLFVATSKSMPNHVGTLEILKIENQLKLQELKNSI